MQTTFARHEARLLELWQRLVRIIGIHTVNVLMERAIWEASHRHPGISLIQHDDESFCFTDLEEAWAGRSEVEVAESFNDLHSELLLILARLLGKEMAQRLAEELDSKLPEQE